MIIFYNCQIFNLILFKIFRILSSLSSYFPGAQLSGFNSVSFYLQTILESTQTSISPEVCSVIIGLIQLLASFCTTMVTDRFGRKPILTSTLVGLAVGMVSHSLKIFCLWPLNCCLMFIISMVELSRYNAIRHCHNQVEVHQSQRDLIKASRDKSRPSINQ